MGIINKKDKKKEKSGGKMTDWYRNRLLAELLHNVDCAWTNGAHECGSMECEWEMEDDEDHPWAQAVHGHYVGLAETIMEKSGQNTNYIEQLINLHQNHSALTRVIAKTVYFLCESSAINVTKNVST